MFKLRLVLIALYLWAGGLAAQQPAFSAGTAGGLFLRSPLSARASALSGAFAARPADENALLYNPAGLAGLPAVTLSLDHSEWLSDIRFEHLLLALPVYRSLSAALSLAHMGMPSLAGRGQFGEDTGTFDVSSSFIQGGIGFSPHPALSLGVTVKYLRDQLAGFSAGGLAYDAGLLLRLGSPYLTLGASLQHLGSEIRYDAENQPLPRTFRLGLRYRHIPANLGFSIDLVKSRDTGYQIHSGIEYNYEDSFFLRAGNRFQAQDALYPAFGGGIGISRAYRVDYALVTGGELGAVHQVGLTFRLSVPEPAVTPPSPRRPASLSGERAALRPPEGLVAKIEAGRLEIRWREVAGAQYRLYARYQGQRDWKLLNNRPLAQPVFRLQKPRQAGIYYFRVTAVINGRESGYSREVSYVTP